MKRSRQCNKQVSKGVQKKDGRTPNPKLSAQRRKLLATHYAARYRVR